MAERRIEVRTFIVRLMCDQPGCNGELLRSGMMLLSDPPQYPHACNRCGWEFTPEGGKSYPRIEHEERGEGQT